MGRKRRKDIIQDYLDNQAEDSGEESDQNQVSSEEDEKIELYMKPRKREGILSRIKDENLEDLAEEFNEREIQYNLEKDDEEVIERVHKKPKRKIAHLQTESKVFLVRCMIGQERQICQQLFRKYFEIRGSNPELIIHSILHLDGVNGVVYIEANSLQSVTELTTGINNIQSKYIKLVPHSQF